MPEIDDPIQRFVAVVKFYLSGWHIRPPGVKKPLNPILGEYFTCYWEYPDHTRGYYIAEQTSHHPPKSSYFYMAPEHHIRIDGTLKPRSRFLGNSAASLMEGIAILTLLNRGTNGEKYVLTQPNMYARGILFGKMKYELGDHSVVRCPEHGLVADVEFKTKGYFGGTYNAIGGVIRNEKTEKVLYELSGMWNGEMFIKDVMTGHRELLFDATNAKPTPPIVRPLEEQDERESPKLWHKVVTALNQRNHDAATDEKSRIEEMQRAEAAQRAESGAEFRPRLFRPVKGGPGGPEEGFEDLDWILDEAIDAPTIEGQTQQILSIVPIVQGSQTQIKPRQDRPSNQLPAQPPEPSPVPAASATNGGHAGDLVDFGQNEAPAPVANHEQHQMPVQGQFVEEPVGLAQPLQPSQPSFQQSNPSNLLDYNAGPPPSSAPPTKGGPLPVTRQDTGQSDVDEFVDADDGLRR
ncbi:MAG: hypothetical protein M1817_003396 [Caeruleum heppii]|nr:MAG: hypothetical protein M1817_003396 [Caeruleum heppii]